MAAVWSDQNKFQRWLDVEVAACEAWAELGQVPAEAAAKIRRDATFDVEKINEYIRITHHDVTAFLRSVAETLGEEGRYVHFGLTSSVGWDTATGLQLRDVCRLHLKGIDGRSVVLARQALADAITTCAGRNHGV